MLGKDLKIPRTLNKQAVCEYRDDGGDLSEDQAGGGLTDDLVPVSPLLLNKNKAQTKKSCIDRLFLT